MDSLIPRQIKFLKLMLLEDEYRPISYFAKNLKVSNKTLQNDLKIINKYIEKFDIKVYIKRGMGICIDKDAKKNINFINNLNMNIKSKSIDISVEQRRIEILMDLLLNSELKTSINKLSEKYFVSKTSIVNDLKFIEDEYLSKNKIYLNKTMNGTYISGNEVDIRKCIANIIENIICEDNYKVCEESKIEKSTFDELVEVFDFQSVKFVENSVKELENNLNCEICEPYYINLITHILICIRRIKEGNKIEDYKIESEILKNENKIYKEVEKLVKKIETEYLITVNKQEIIYIYKYIVSSRFENEVHFKDINEEIYESIVYEIIEMMSLFLGINLKTDTILKKGLLMHIKPMLNRLNYDIQIKNPLNNDIIEYFNDIFIMTKIIIFIISEKYNLYNISDDEITYLTTYLQAAIERNSDEKKVLVVCHSGYGTSQFLASKLKQCIPQIKIEGIISSRKLKKENLDNIDFIISTVETDFKGKDHIIVSAILSNSDVNNIKKMLDKKCDNKYIQLDRFFSNEINKNLNFNKEILNDKELKKFKFKNGLVIYIDKYSDENSVFLNKKCDELEIYLLSKDEEYLKNILANIYFLYSNKKLEKLYKFGEK